MQPLVAVFLPLLAACYGSERTAFPGGLEPLSDNDASWPSDTSSRSLDMVTAQLDDSSTAHARGYEFFSYFFTFWITPMFVFSGVFFDIERFPQAVQALAWVLPMTHLIAVIRPPMVDQALGTGAASLHVGYVLLLTAAGFWLAYRRLRQRMFD